MFTLIGILLSLAVEWNVFLIYSFIVLAISVSFVCSSNKKVLLLCLFAAVTFVAILNSTLALRIDNPYRSFLDDEAEILLQVERVVQKTPRNSVYDALILGATKNSESVVEEAKARIRIFSTNENYKTFSFEKGDVLKINGNLLLPNSARNPRGFDYRKFLEFRGIRYTLSAQIRDVEKVRSAKLSSIDSITEWVRKRTHEVFERSVGGEEGALMLAMLLGDRWLLPAEITNSFRETGLSHILAISGLHVGFIVLMLEKFFDVLPLTQKTTTILKMIILWFYSILTGGTPSVLRAVFMATIFLGAKFFGRKADPINTLALAAIGILFLRPLELFNVGFQLSFAAVAGLILFTKKISDKLIFLPKKLSATIAATVAAQIGVLPLVPYYFNVLSIIALPANLIFVPITGVLVCFGFVIMIFGLIIPSMIHMFAWPIKIIASFFISATDFVASIPFSFIEIVSPSIVFLICFYILVVILSNEKPSWIKNVPFWCALLIIVPLLNNTIQPILNNNLKVVFLDVGQGDAIYIRTPDDKHILLDGGGRLQQDLFGFDPGRDVVVPFLLKNNVGKLDLMIKSHDHADHIGGLRAVARSMKVENFLEHPPSVGSEIYHELKEILKKQEATTLLAYAGKVVKVGRYVEIEVFYPDKQGLLLNRFYDDDDNNRSLVFELRYKEGEVLFTGDIYQDLENHLAADWNKRIDILKVAHHGSRSSTSDIWLDAINPDMAVIQVGRNNFGHPHFEVLDRLEKRETRIFRNDIHGAVICKFDGKEWSIITMTD